MLKFVHRPTSHLCHILIAPHCFRSIHPHHARFATAVFSVELERTLRTPDTFAKRLELYTPHIDRMMESFRVQPTERQKMREGRVKKSFVYLLIDSRLSENLSGEMASGEHTLFGTWQRFLRSIFYVGKGKNGRPYDHLYEALELYKELAPEQMRPSE